MYKTKVKIKCDLGCQEGLLYDMISKGLIEQIKQGAERWKFIISKENIINGSKERENSFTEDELDSICYRYIQKMQKIFCILSSSFRQILLFPSDKRRTLVRVRSCTKSSNTCLRIQISLLYLSGTQSWSFSNCLLPFLLCLCYRESTVLPVVDEQREPH